MRICLRYKRTNTPKSKIEIRSLSDSLKGMIKDMLTLAIIDSGVNLSEPGRMFHWEANEDGQIQPCAPAEDFHGHGTVCCLIIKKYFPDPLVIHSIKVLNPETNRGNKEKLLSALRWCIRENVNIVHMSIGSTYPRDFHEIQLCVGELKRHGIHIIAAASNRGKLTYPAYDERVIGVASEETLRDEAYIYCPNTLEGTPFYASSRHVLLNPLGEFFETDLFNSYAAPVVTAKALKILQKSEQISSKSMLQELIQTANQMDAEKKWNRTTWKGNCPVVLLLNQNSKTQISILQELKRKFTENGYLCQTAAYLQEKEDEVEKIPDRINLSEYIQWFCHFFQCDIAVLALPDATISVEEYHHFDLILRDEKDGFSIIESEKEEKMLAYATDISELCFEIINILQ